MLPHYTKFVTNSGLFFGSEAIEPHFSEPDLERLRQQEFWDWVSSLYWLEGVAAKYAAAMAQHFPAEREAWLRVMADEVKNQSSIGTWLIENGAAPYPPTVFVQMATVECQK